MVIVLLGAVRGAGKGTQCKRVAEKYKLLHLSSGDILRSNRKEGTELGKKAAEYMDSGKTCAGPVDNRNDGRRYRSGKRQLCFGRFPNAQLFRLKNSIKLLRQRREK
jgi:adenylate kinase family enzyme